MPAFRLAAIASLLCATSLGLSGCDSFDLSQFKGEYKGWETRLSSQAPLTTETIVAKASLTGESSLSVHVAKTKSSDDTSADLSLTQVSDGEIAATLALSNVNNGRAFAEIRLKRDAYSCFTSETASKVCFEGDEINIDLEWADRSRYSLTLRKNLDLPALETPKPYTSSALVQLALSKGFDSLLDFEKLKLAQATAKNAEMNLLPHISAFSATSFIQFQPLSMLRLAGELTPFLFPSRWLRKDASVAMAEAERQAFRISQLNRALSVETLIAQATRDQKLLAAFSERSKTLRSLRSDVAVRENIGLMPRGSTDTLDGLVGAIDQSALGTLQSSRDSLSALAIAAGFYNPRAIETLDDDRILDTGELIRILSAISINELRESTLLRSLELRQLDSLIDAARSERTARSWNWLDPSPEGNGTLGFALGSYLEIQDTKVSQALLQRDQMQAILLQKVESFDSSLKTTIKGYEIARAQAEIQLRRVKRLSQQFYLGLGVNLLELATATQDLIRADIALISIEATLRVHEAQLRRLRSI